MSAIPESGIPAPDRRGRYYCQFGCHDPESQYPPRHWKTEKGIAKHIAECPCAPANLPPPPPPKIISPPAVFGNCLACQVEVMEGETIWECVGGGFWCFDCRRFFPVWPEGWLYCAGMKLEGFDDIVA
jgi:hypothetical protein